jgi:hypothetical protein
MQYFQYSYFIQPNKSTAAYPDGAKQPCPGKGPPPKGAGPSGIDVWCRVEEPHEHFYDFGLANATVSRIKCLLRPSTHNRYTIGSSERHRFVC